MKTALVCMVLTSVVSISAREFDVGRGRAFTDLPAALDAVRAWRAGGASQEVAHIRLSPGVWVLGETLRLDERDHDLVLEAEKPGKTAIIGGVALTGWRADTGGFWRLDLPDGVVVPEQLYLGEERMIRAREPDEGFYQLKSVTQRSNTLGGVELEIGLPEPFPPLRKEEQPTLQVFHKWDTTRGWITSFDSSSRVVRLRGEPMKPWNPITPGRRYVLENTRAGCDQPLEWYSEGHSLFIRSNPEKTIVAPRLSRLIEISGSQRVTIRNLILSHQGYWMPERGDIAAQAANFVEAAIHLERTRDCVIEDCRIGQTGGYGIWFKRGSTGGIVRRCHLVDLGAGGIRVGEMRVAQEEDAIARGIRVEDTLIESIGRIHPSAVGVWIAQSPDNIVRHCEIRDTYYTGISVGWTWGYGASQATNNLVEGNYIHQIGQGALCDLGGLYTLGVSPGTRITGNYFADIEAWEYGGWGMYTDEGSTGVEMSSNIVVRTRCRTRPERAGGFHQHYGSTNLIAYNLFVDSSGPQIQASRVEEHVSFTLLGNTIINTGAPLVGGTWNAEGPWAKLRFASKGNRFFGATTNGYAQRSFDAWRLLGHDTDSVELSDAPVIPRPPVLRTGPAWSRAR